MLTRVPLPTESGPDGSLVRRAPGASPAMDERGEEVDTALDEAWMSARDATSREDGSAPASWEREVQRRAAYGGGGFAGRRGG